MNYYFTKACRVFILLFILIGNVYAKPLGVIRAFNETTSSDFSHFLVRVLQQQNLTGISEVKLISHQSQNKTGTSLKIIVGIHGTVITVYEGTNSPKTYTYANRYSHLYEQIERTYWEDVRDSVYWAMFVQSDKKIKRKNQIDFYEDWKADCRNGKFTDHPDAFEPCYYDGKENLVDEFDLSKNEFTCLLNYVLQALGMPAQTTIQSSLIDLVYDRTNEEGQLCFHPANPRGNYVAKADNLEMEISEREVRIKRRTKRQKYTVSRKGEEIIPGLLDSRYENFEDRPGVYFNNSALTNDFAEARKKYIKKLFYNDINTGNSLVIDTIAAFRAGIDNDDPTNRGVLYFPMAKMDLPRAPGDAAMINAHMYGKRIGLVKYYKPLKGGLVVKNQLNMMNTSFFSKKAKDYFLYNVSNPPFIRTGMVYNYLIAADEYFKSGQKDAALQQYLAAQMKVDYSQATPLQRLVVKEYIADKLIQIFEERGQKEYVNLLKFNQQLLQLQALHPKLAQEHNKAFKRMEDAENKQIDACTKIQGAIVTLVITGITIVGSLTTMASTMSSVANATSQAVNAVQPLLQADMNSIATQIQIAASTVNAVKEGNELLGNSLTIDFARDIDTFDVVWSHISRMTTENIVNMSRLMKKEPAYNPIFQSRFTNMLYNYLYPSIIAFNPEKPLEFGSPDFNAFIKKFRNYEYSVFLNAYFDKKVKPAVSPAFPSAVSSAVAVSSKDKVPVRNNDIYAEPDWKTTPTLNSKPSNGEIPVATPAKPVKKTPAGSGFWNDEN